MYLRHHANKSGSSATRAAPSNQATTSLTMPLSLEGAELWNAKVTMIGGKAPGRSQAAPGLGLTLQSQKKSETKLSIWVVIKSQETCWRPSSQLGLF